LRRVIVAVVLAEKTPEWVVKLQNSHLWIPVRIALALLMAYLLTLLVQRAIRRFVKRTIELPGVDPARAEGRQRALAGALRGALIGVIWTVAVITIIGELGINIGAFVATATVVGGAVAFGAQQLVRDVISGLFVLSEDQYGVGDVVDVGHATGTVERITLRSVRVRDGIGGIWHVPHGGVLRVANLSKDSMAVLDLEVSRATPLATLDAEAQALCAALAADTEAAPNLVGEPRAVGVTTVTDDRLVYRLMVGTMAGTHDAVRRRWRRLALEAFEAGQLSAPSLAAPVVNVNTVPPTAPEE
jgi:small conductance mechanosensitive channel